MERVTESRRSRLHRRGAAFAAALVEWNHTRHAEETRAPLELGVVTTRTFCRSESEILNGESPASSGAERTSPGEAPFFQHPGTLTVAFSAPGPERWDEYRLEYVEPTWHVIATVAADTFMVIYASVVESDEDGARVLEGEGLADALERLDDRICKAAKAAQGES
jgi:hypothetical protein